MNKEEVKCKCLLPNGLLKSSCFDGCACPCHQPQEETTPMKLNRLDRERMEGNTRQLRELTAEIKPPTHPEATPTDWGTELAQEILRFRDGYGQLDHIVERVRTLIQEAKKEAKKEAVGAEQERCFDVLMGCMPKSAENIATITERDARIMLQKFVNAYWNHLTQRKEKE